MSPIFSDTRFRNLQSERKRRTEQDYQGPFNTREAQSFFFLYKHPPQIITVILDNGSDPLQEFCMSHFLGRHSLSRKLVQFNFQMVPSIQVKMHKYKSPSNTS
uniref:Uncharacterized protein n=1 Tax=Micrurus corallinus TaxID=54390 RepID=A0A2D4FL79_MICCO